MGSRTKVLGSVSLALALMLAVAGCRKELPPTVTGDIPPIVTVVPSSATLTVGDTLRFYANTVGLGGAVTASWSSSARSVANVDSTGLVMAVSPGNAILTATVNGVTGNATLTVVAAPAVALSPDTAFVVAGRTVQLHATLTNPASDTLVWSSADTTIATVSDSGLVTGVRFGKTRVTASLGDLSATAWVYVNDGSGIGASVAIGSLTQSGTGAPVDTAAMAGSVDAALSYKMGADTGSVRLVVDQDTVCSHAIGYGEATVTCTLDTAAFDSASGAVAFGNGPHTLEAELFDAAGNLGATAQLNVTFANADTMLLDIAGAGTTTDSAGTTWQTGALTVRSPPLLYSGARADSALFTLMVSDTSASASESILDRDPSDGLSVVFPAAPTGSPGIRDPAATVKVTVYEAGGASLTRTSAPFAYDNRGG